MRITVVGAGPAGLYLGILLKKADAAHEVTILERNAPDATFGWGVVFSEETLGALRDADFPTYLEITDTFARWDSVDIRYRDRLLRSRGHTFSAIARTRLLNILQRRCLELGVTLRFGVEVDDPAALAAEADLLVAADGVNSMVRRAHEAEFGSNVTPQGCKYVWFGTDLVLDAFTFVFRQTEHGLFQVHSYPFDENTSTFIVECPEATWRRAGLDAVDERGSIGFCEALFAEDLAGHRLLSNRSTWLSFPRVRNSSWHHGNIVLLGDAAHTAHFSIGSGTKLAMEDAVSLANSLVRHGNVAAALVDYELERQPVVERFQQAAGDSAGYFERVGAYTRLGPIQFAFNLLTRSGRISHANLAVRDPEFVRVLDTWFTDDALGRPPLPALTPPPAFAPLRIGNLVLPNRIVRAARDGDLSSAARGGAGLVLTGLVTVSQDGRTEPDCPTLCADRDVERWRGPVAEAHAAGALAGVRLGHAGRRGAARPARHGVDLPLGADGWPLLAASALPYLSRSAVPKEADADDLARLRADFASAAARAAEAGFDVLELDLAHGHLLAGFLSPLTNRREDEYGGDAAGRLRFPIEVLREVRAVWPSDRLLAVRLTVTDWARGGLTVSDGVAVARELMAAGAELIHVEAGQTVAESRPQYRRGFLTGLSDRVRAQAAVPTLVGGYLTTQDEVNTIVAAGRGDLCLVELAETDLDRAAVG
ncbi:hypothetical protein F0L68_30420 [Solihabitans fulvus]|uniref:Anthraniloyl-CoA monooxygenase n=1 Tax=Solihabitans fulvus TaxID=1892852 RepID=A0A5B2WVI3_9PSEU|nr:FAD-dependent monooxygenase [Solihabitans fulvus]KAA2254496.1 hypothetical protein F0L68_30420 [Solihabitans fulvus]